MILRERRKETGGAFTISSDAASAESIEGTTTQLPLSLASKSLGIYRSNCLRLCFGRRVKRQVERTAFKGSKLIRRTEGVHAFLETRTTREGKSMQSVCVRHVY